MANKRYKQFTLAQHFLRNSGMVRSLIKTSSIGPGDIVYEIGAGRGIITAELARTARKVIAIEKDPILVRHLRGRFGDACNVEIIEGDFLRYRIAEGAFKVVGNIPFNRTADIVRKLLFGSLTPKEAYLVMQKEAARKFSGSPKETEFSVLVKPLFHLQIIQELRRTDFTPIPKVDCVLLQIRKRRSPLISQDDMVLYRKFVRFGFRRWKKNLKMTFKPVCTYRQWKRLAKGLGFPIDVRPTELTFEQWVGLFDCFRERVSEDKRRDVLGFDG